jgi:two-component system, NarL family, response regulator DegU
MKSKPKIKTIIVDESDLFRNALTELLTENGIDVIGSATNERDMLKQISENKPDVLIYDFYNSAERFELTMEKIKTIAPDIKLMVMCFENSPVSIDFCLASGAKGFCDKNLVDFGDIINAIKKIEQGETVILTNQLA